MYRSRPATLPEWPLRINPNSPQAIGLAGLWTARGQRSGYVLDDLSGYGNAGRTAVAGTGTSPTIQPSAFGQSMRFYGASGVNVGYVTLSRAFTSLPLSVCCWFRPDSAGVNNLLFWTGASNGWNGHYLIAGSSATLLAASAQNTTFATSSGVAYVAGQWQHAAGVWASAASRQAFLNGKPDTLDTTSKTPAAWTVSYIGAAWVGSTVGYVGNIGEMRVYNRVLSQAEIAAMYHPGTRWDLYSQPRRYYYAPSAAVAAGSVGIYGKRGAVALPGGVRIEAVQ